MPQLRTIALHTGGRGPRLRRHDGVDLTLRPRHLLMAFMTGAAHRGCVQTSAGARGPRSADPMKVAARSFARSARIVLPGRRPTPLRDRHKINVPYTVLSTGSVFDDRFPRPSRDRLERDVFSRLKLLHPAPNWSTIM
jgi:hypothetical protein